VADWRRKHMHILAHTPLGAMQSLLRFLPLTAASGRRCSARNVWTGPRRATTCRLGRPDGADAGPSTARVTLLTDEEAAAAALPAALQADLRRKQTATVHRAGPEPQRLVYVGLGGAGQLSAAGYRKAAVQAVAALRAAKCMAADIEVTGSNSQETLGVRRLHLNFLHFGFAGCQQAILTNFPSLHPPPFISSYLSPSSSLLHPFPPLPLLRCSLTPLPASNQPLFGTTHRTLHSTNRPYLSRSSSRIIISTSI